MSCLLYCSFDSKNIWPVLKGFRFEALDWNLDQIFQK